MIIRAVVRISWSRRARRLREFDGVYTRGLSRGGAVEAFVDLVRLLGNGRVHKRDKQVFLAAHIN